MAYCWSVNTGFNGGRYWRQCLIYAHLSTGLVSIARLDSCTRIVDREEVWKWLGCDPGADNRGAGAGCDRLGTLRFAATAQIGCFGAALRCAQDFGARLGGRGASNFCNLTSDLCNLPYPCVVNASASSVFCSTSCAFADPVAGLALPDRFTDRIGRSCAILRSRGNI